MGSFDASLRTIGDRTGIAATLTVTDGRLSISAGDQSIGDWSLEEIQLEPTPTGYRMAAEGEQILIDLPDADQFTLALNGKKVKAPKAEKRPRNRSPKHVSEPEKVETAPSEPVRATPAVSAKADDRATEAPDEATGFMATIDRALDSAHQKWGGLFPSWAFTRGMAFVLAASLVLLLALPQIAFYALLLGGVALVMVGAVLYTDSVLSARWLPGRMTPMHVLLFGVGFILTGVLVGMASRSMVNRLALAVILVGGTYTAMLIAGRKTA
jgi:hypothetical protein